MPRLCSDMRMAVVRKWTKKISFTAKSSDHQDDRGVMSMMKNSSSKKKIADETLVSTTTSNCTKSSDLHDPQDDGHVISMNCCSKKKKKIADETLISTTKSNCTKSSDLHDPQDDGHLISMNCCSKKKKIADETLVSRTTSNCCTSTAYNNFVAAAAATNNFEMSPTRALRVAMLKRRFADTIFKATHRDCNNSTKQLERSELEKERIKEKQRFEAEFKAAKAAAATAACTDQNSKKRRLLFLSDQRAAARTALEKMEKSVYVGGDNASLLKGLETLCGDSVAYQLFYGKGCVGAINNQDVNLEKLGLFLKKDYLDSDFQQEDDAVVAMELEEGEILV